MFIDVPPALNFNISEVGLTYIKVQYLSMNNVLSFMFTVENSTNSVIFGTNVTATAESGMFNVTELVPGKVYNVTGVAYNYVGKSSAVVERVTLLSKPSKFGI